MLLWVLALFLRRKTVFPLFVTVGCGESVAAWQVFLKGNIQGIWFFWYRLKNPTWYPVSAYQVFDIFTPIVFKEEVKASRFFFFIYTLQLQTRLQLQIYSLRCTTTASLGDAWCHAGVGRAKCACSGLNRREIKAAEGQRECRDSEGRVLADKLPPPASTATWTASNFKIRRNKPHTSVYWSWTSGIGLDHSRIATAALWVVVVVVLNMYYLDFIHL